MTAVVVMPAANVVLIDQHTTMTRRWIKEKAMTFDVASPIRTFVNTSIDASMTELYTKTFVVSSTMLYTALLG